MRSRIRRRVLNRIRVTHRVIEIPIGLGATGVQVGIWGGSASNTCLGHHEIAGGVHGESNSPLLLRCTLKFSDTRYFRMTLCGQATRPGDSWTEQTVAFPRRPGTPS